MPIEVTPSPYHINPLFSLPLHHPGGWASAPPPSHPPHLINVTPPPPSREPGRIMPNGSRNPWAAPAPSHSENYRPSSERTLARAENLFAVSIGGGSVRGGSSIVPRSLVNGSQGGYREIVDEEGWNGSLGRAHMGHSPDMTSTAGGIHPRLITRGSMMGLGSSSGTGFGHSPSSWANHARMTPAGPGPDLVPTSYLRPPPSYGGVRISSHHIPGGKALSRSRSREGAGGNSHRSGGREMKDDCPECQRARGQSRSKSDSHDHRTSSSSHSPPRLEVREATLERKNSKRSACSECISERD
ncbi:hypothetical protein CI109_107244 [Kwoniella shandongensis]|uniref:Uncharacterized protein n=1 Tax=Kwoniella shandongensis TaxID=1734106 RepID=A0A5M6C236_9TREE|nr:uncharacterized protein CI109_002527 [Kwoniella shandongensis]KAA5529186.1 hypothetical protein CI109_002527 [Kwoniella shandongensis]